jgi:hypothetical protein
LRPRTLPADAARSRKELSELGVRLHAALAKGALAQVLLDQDELFAVLAPAAARRVASARALVRVSEPSQDARAQWSSVRFAGLCVQQGRVEPAGGVLGLTQAGFVFERALLEGRDPAGAPLGAWVEGVFLLTERGFFAVALERIEAPRRDHADLELAVCELRAGP